MPLSGTVTMNGAPLSPKPGETAFVEFTADKAAGNNSPHLPRGDIGADGKYTISTTSLPGIEPGAWKARIVYQKSADADSKNPYAPPVSMIAHKFSDFGSSGFQVTADRSTPNAPEFVVTK